MLYFSNRYYTQRDELTDDDKFVTYPHRIGRSVLICGKKSTYFPFQCFVGPDYPCMFVTYILIIGPTALFINNIAIYWGGLVVFVTLFLMLVTLTFFSLTACSDPGIVFLDPEGDEEIARPSNSELQLQTYQATQNITNKDLESNAVTIQDITDSISATGGVLNISNRESNNSDHSSTEPLTAATNQHKTSSTDSSHINSDVEMASTTANPSNRITTTYPPQQSSAVTSSSVLPTSPSSTSRPTAATVYSSVDQFSQQKVFCGLCNIDRPRNAFHCHDCGVCVIDLDHHCPWTGKCIGKKTIQTFYYFLWSLSLLIAFVIAMVMVTAIRGSPLFFRDS